MAKNLLVGQSGGPTAAINATLAGVFSKAKECGIDKVYGMRYGIGGFLDGKYVDLSEQITSTEDLELLKRTPSAFLGSCRYKLPNEGEVYDKIFEKLNELEIKYFLYIGGNDSMDTIKKLSAYGRKIGSDIAFIGVPKTIDNDLPVTDHTPGFGSAAKYIATSFKELRRDAVVYDMKSVAIVEIMGRDAGWLTAAAALADDGNSKGADLIYLPERTFDITDFLARVKKLCEERGNIIIAVSEGVKTADGKYVCDMREGLSGPDAFGHSMLSGTGFVLATLVNTMLGIKSRAVELSTLQRCGAHILSGSDMEEAFSAGAAAVSRAVEGMSGIMVTFERVSDNPYEIKIGTVNVNMVANEVKFVPQDWIPDDGKINRDAIRKYMLPLIDGEFYPIVKNGLPQHLVIKE